MRIEQIKISNFRSYKGDVKIDFENNSGDKNITLISGKNGFGKTSFLTCFRCFLSVEPDQKEGLNIIKSRGECNFLNYA